jgi:hypothetical protein
MADFCVFFPSGEVPHAVADVPASFSRLDSILSGVLHADKVRSRVVHGAAVLLSTSFGRCPQFYARPDGSGWIVVKGIMADIRSATPAVNLEQLLDQILSEQPGDLNRYEGVYAVAAWDARKAEGWAFNDQVSGMNLYYGADDGGIYVATPGLALARALGRGLEPHSVQEFLLRNNLLAPGSMFAGLQRVHVGEHIRCRTGKLSHARHWYAYEPRTRYRSMDQAAEVVASMAVDRISRYSAIAKPVIGDLTGGLDSRLLACAIDKTGQNVTVTVNGPTQSEDVRISHRVAEAMGWEMRYFDIESLWTKDITPDMRRELVYRTSGELPFTEVYHHLLSRPLLGQEFGLHMIGIGGEFARTFPWEEAVKLRYGSLVVGGPPAELFVYDASSRFYSRFQEQIKANNCRQLGASATQQWDATFIWKMTSHASQFLSSVHNWLPSVAPMMSAGVVRTMTAIPWTMRLGGQLQRQIIFHLSPRAAEIESWHSARQEYRGTAQPGLKTIAAEMCRYTQRLARAVERRVFKGILSKRKAAKLPISLVTQGHVPLFTPELRQFLDPKTMFSRGLYAVDGLRHVLGGDEMDWRAKLPLIVRLAQVEQLCRELDVKPEVDFWTPVLADRGP